MTGIWTNSLVSFAYRYQKEARPYKDMMVVFGNALPRKKGMKVLDIGCGSGRILKLIKDDAALEPSSIMASDVSGPALEEAKKEALRRGWTCPVEFIQSDISSPQWCASLKKGDYDLVTAGLSLQYAEARDLVSGRWTTKAYERVLSDIHGLLKPGGQLVFSANTPNPDFSIIARESKKEIFRVWWKAPFMLGVAAIMVAHGRKLVREANRGRFNYLPVETVAEFLKKAGFRDIKFTLTYAGLAWVISCQK